MLLNAAYIHNPHECQVDYGCFGLTTVARGKLRKGPVRAADHDFANYAFCANLHSHLTHPPP